MKKLIIIALIMAFSQICCNGDNKGKENKVTKNRNIKQDEEIQRTIINNNKLDFIRFFAKNGTVVLMIILTVYWLSLMEKKCQKNLI